MKILAAEPKFKMWSPTFDLEIRNQKK
jgi:hypothetical protein